MKKILKCTAVLMFISLLLIICLAGCRGSDNVGDVYDDLIGRWRTPSLPPMAFNLNDDGTGTRGGEPFTWGVSDGNLNINPEGQARVEHWDFSIDANHQLNISSQQQVAIDLYLDKVGEIYPALIGTWTWDDDPEWRYYFNDLGGGRRGFEVNMISFEWGVVDGQLRLFLALTSGVTDSWHMTIDGDTLRLENVLYADQVFYYTRE